MVGNPSKQRNLLLTGDTRAIVQIYHPATARGSLLDQADRGNTTQSGTRSALKLVSTSSSVNKPQYLTAPA